jgi:hypothetical protein
MLNCQLDIHAPIVPQRVCWETTSSAQEA